MKNKVILITGANKGIGKMLSLEFSKIGVYSSSWKKRRVVR